MSDARKILDERLAKGEISEEEHEKLVARLDSKPSPPATPEPPQNAQTEMPKGSLWQGIAGLVLAVVVYNWGSNLATSITMDCVNEGRGSFQFCNENAVKWPIIYAIYAFAAFMAFFGAVNLFLPKK